MPVSYDHCAKIEDIVAEREFGVPPGATAKLCTWVTTETIQFGSKNCGGTSTPPLEYIQFTVASEDITDEFDFEIDCWFGIEQNKPDCWWIGVDQSPVGTICYKLNCGSKVLTYSELEQAATFVVEELRQRAVKGSAFDKFVTVVGVILALVILVTIGDDIIALLGGATAGVLLLAVGATVAARLID